MADGESNSKIEDRKETSDANVTIEQLTPKRDIQEDILKVANSLGVFILLPIIEAPAVAQDFSFTAAHGADNIDEELGFVLE